MVLPERIKWVNVPVGSIYIDRDGRKCKKTAENRAELVDHPDKGFCVANTAYEVQLLREGPKVLKAASDTGLIEELTKQAARINGLLEVFRKHPPGSKVMVEGTMEGLWGEDSVSVEVVQGQGTAARLFLRPDRVLPPQTVTGGLETRQELLEAAERTLERLRQDAREQINGGSLSLWDQDAYQLAYAYLNDRNGNAGNGATGGQVEDESPTPQAPSDPVGKPAKPAPEAAARPYDPPGTVWISLPTERLEELHQRSALLDKAVKSLGGMVSLVELMLKVQGAWPDHECFAAGSFQLPAARATLAEIKSFEGDNP